MRARCTFYRAKLAGVELVLYGKGEQVPGSCDAKLCDDEGLSVPMLAAGRASPDFQVKDLGALGRYDVRFGQCGMEASTFMEIAVSWLGPSELQGMACAAKLVGDVLACGRFGRARLGFLGEAADAASVASSEIHAKLDGLAGNGGMGTAEVYLSAVAAAEFSDDELFEGVGAACVSDSRLNPKPPVLTIKVAALTINEGAGVYPGAGAHVAELQAKDAGANEAYSVQRPIAKQPQKVDVQEGFKLVSGEGLAVPLLAAGLASPVTTSAGDEAVGPALLGLGVSWLGPSELQGLSCAAKVVGDLVARGRFGRARVGSLKDDLLLEPVGAAKVAAFRVALEHNLNEHLASQSAAAGDDDEGNTDVTLQGVVPDLGLSSDVQGGMPKRVAWADTEGDMSGLVSAGSHGWPACVGGQKMKKKKKKKDRSLALAVPAACGPPAAVVTSEECLATFDKAANDAATLAEHSDVEVRVLRKVLQFFLAADIRGLATMSVEEKAVVLQLFDSYHISEGWMVLVRLAFGLQLADLARLPT